MKKLNHDLQNQSINGTNCLNNSESNPSVTPTRNNKGLTKRKRTNEFNHSHRCPYDDCKKSYGSNVALNLHIKLKHDGGTKKERESYVVCYLIILEKNG